MDFREIVGQVEDTRFYYAVNPILVESTLLSFGVSSQMPGPKPIEIRICIKIISYNQLEFAPLRPQVVHPEAVDLNSSDTSSTGADVDGRVSSLQDKMNRNERLRIRN
jgi:hypothetical protein